MSRRKEEFVHAGFEVGTGNPVSVPLAHTFVAGQTQQSGKTTALRAIVERSNRRALGFFTKRGEQLAGRRIAPYLPREGDQPIHWRMVETILASSLGEKKLKYERFWIMQAAKGARSLQDVRRNVDRLRAKAKARSKEAYEMIGEYLELVLPEMRDLGAAHELDLKPGMNVIDLSEVSQPLAAMVIRACLARINEHESDVLTVFPEAWEFAPRSRVTPASFEAQAMARKGAVLGNFLMCDSQDIAGVDPVIRLGSRLWMLGVQRELNELKRTLQMFPGGVKKPKPEEVTSLSLGQFVCCWGQHAVRTYIQPAWMNDDDARAIARGEMAIDDIQDAPTPVAAVHVDAWERPKLVPLDDPHTVTATAAVTNDRSYESEDEAMSKEDVNRIEKQIDRMASSMDALVATLSKQSATANETKTPTEATLHRTGAKTIAAEFDRDELYKDFKRRLQADAPALLTVLADVPEIAVTEELRTIEASTTGKGALLGTIALMIANGFFDGPRTNDDVHKDLKRRGIKYANVTFGMNMAELNGLGFLIKDNGSWVANATAKKRIKRV